MTVIPTCAMTYMLYDETPLPLRGRVAKDKAPLQALTDVQGAAASAAKASRKAVGITKVVQSEAYIACLFDVNRSGIHLEKKINLPFDPSTHSIRSIDLPTQSIDRSAHLCLLVVDSNPCFLSALLPNLVIRSFMVLGRHTTRTYGLVLPSALQLDGS